MTNQTRLDRGVPADGQFAPEVRPEPDLALRGQGFGLSARRFSFRLLYGRILFSPHGENSDSEFTMQGPCGR